MAFRAAVFASLLGSGFAVNLRVVKNDPHGDDPHGHQSNDWHKDLGVDHHDKHNIDTKAGQDNTSTPYNSVQDRVNSDLVGRIDRTNMTDYACDKADWTALRCGTDRPWSAEIPFRPKLDSWMDQCKACKIRACNSDLKTPNGKEGCRCVFKAVPGGFTSDCHNVASGFGEWKACGAVRTCDKYGAGGQCVHPCWTMPAAEKATNPNIKITDASEVSLSGGGDAHELDIDKDKEDDVEKEVEKETKQTKEHMEKDEKKKDKKDKKDDKKDKKGKKDDKGIWHETQEAVGMEPGKRSGASTNSAACAFVALLLSVALRA